jgi:DnaJ-class molecular chaperone
MINLYEILGVAKDATAQQIKKAYRKRAAMHHPDTGGDPEKFKALVLAYNVLYDPAKRERYDKGESAESIGQAAQSDDQRILGIIMTLFTQIVSSCDPNTTDIIKMIKKNIIGVKEGFVKQIKQHETVINKFDIAIKRMKIKNGENLFVQSANAQITQQQKEIAKLNEEIRIGEGAERFLSAYSYKADKGPKIERPSMNIFDVINISIDPKNFRPGGFP